MEELLSITGLRILTRINDIMQSLGYSKTSNSEQLLL